MRRAGEHGEDAGAGIMFQAREGSAGGGGCRSLIGVVGRVKKGLHLVR